MQWIIRNAATKRPIREDGYATEGEALEVIGRLGSVLQSMYEVVYEADDPRVRKMLAEGLSAGAMEGILLPKISVDEYVPSDPDTDHVVLAFFVKGVPEAVHPLQNFIGKCNGVISADFGDSDTVPNTSIVYAEFDRDKIDTRDIEDLVTQVSLICTIKPGDFMLTFPNTNKKFPYEIGVLSKYFDARNRHENFVAQQQAIQSRQAQLQKEIEDEMNDGATGKMLGQDIPLGQDVMQPNKEQAPVVQQPTGDGEGRTKNASAGQEQTINASQKQQIRSLSKNGLPNGEIAKKLGISSATVNKYAEGLEQEASVLVETLVRLF